MLNLNPFEVNADIKDIQLQAVIKREKNLLSLEYILTDPKEKIIVSHNIFSNRREKKLWEHTCFEVFWKIETSPKYWEMNLSSGLDWNVYSFDKYREPQEREDPNFKDISFSAKNSHPYHYYAQVNLENCKLQYQKLKISLTAVLEHKNNKKSYWALAHKKEKPDFHAPESFIITI